MLKKLTVGVAFMILLAHGTSHAQHSVDLESSSPVLQPSAQPFNNYRLVFDHPEMPLAERAATDPLLTEIAKWLAAALDLAATTELPRIEFTSPLRIAELHYKGLLAEPDSWEPIISLGDVMPTGLAMFYDDRLKTIHLSGRWMGGTPAELSVLVRGMVHHYQNLAGLKYRCPQERQQIAFWIQERWLRMFGHNLREDFAMDEASFLLSTQCIP